jgi:hypothetical protein
LDISAKARWHIGTQAAAATVTSSAGSLSRRSSGMPGGRGETAVAAECAVAATSDRGELVAGVEQAEARNAAVLQLATGLGECTLAAGLVSAGLAPLLVLQLPKSRARATQDCSSGPDTEMCAVASFTDLTFWRYAESLLKRWKPATDRTSTG